MRRGGYGQFYDDDARPKRAHRVAVELTTGLTLTRDQAVCHTCDNPRCVRPEHLFVATQRENMKDMYRKSRGRGHYGGPVRPVERGIERYNAKLTDETVRWARTEWSNGRSAPVIARELGVNASTLKKAVRRESWKHVD